MEEFRDEEYEKAKPNWREAFEKVLAGGGKTADYDTCAFCQKITADCEICPVGANELSNYGGRCSIVFRDEVMDNSVRRAICRHVLSTVKDFTDVSEIRDRIAEMLDDEQREKFLGKAEEKGKYRSWLTANPYESPGRPDLLFLIVDYEKDTLSQAIVAAFRNEDMAREVAEFLNER